MDRMIIKIIWSNNMSEDDLDIYCRRVAKDYNVGIIWNPKQVEIVGEARNIQALIVDGQFSEYTDEDLEVEYDKQHNVDSAWCGNWDW